VHELSIAESVVRIAQEHAAGRPVAAVELKVGHLRQVVPSALEFAFQLVAQGTCVQGAELVIEEIPAAGLCRGCGTESVLDGFPLLCAGCGSWDLELLTGEELLVDALELENATTNGEARYGG
jgi:hydrogenase nickel incorporation protein HypA/HybF